MTIDTHGEGSWRHVERITRKSPISLLPDNQRYIQPPDEEGKVGNIKPFQQELRCSLHGTDDSNSVYWDVPSGHRLVIKFITGNISTKGPKDNIGEAYIVVQSSAGIPEYLFIDFPTPRAWRYGGAAEGLITIFNKEVLFYAYDTGGPNDIALYCNRTSRQQVVDYVVTLVGHLECL